MKKTLLLTLAVLAAATMSANRFWNFSDTTVYHTNDTLWTTTTVDGLTFVTDGSSAERVPIFQECSAKTWTDGNETLTFTSRCKFNGKSATAYRWFYLTVQPGDTIEVWSNSTSGSTARTNSIKIGYSGGTITSYSSAVSGDDPGYGIGIYEGAHDTTIALVSNGSNYWYAVRVKNNPDYEYGGATIAVRWFFKHGWGDGTDASWDWRELYPNADSTVYSRMDIYGGTGCNYANDAYGSGSVWVPLGSTNLTLDGNPVIGDSAEFSITPATMQLKIRKTKDGPTTGTEVVADTTKLFSLCGGKVFFDNSQAGWTDDCIYLVAGNATASKTVLMLPDADGTLSCPMPYIKDEITYLAVIGNSHFSGGTWGSANIANANHYSEAYTAGLHSSPADGWTIRPTSAANGCALEITRLEGNYEPAFTAQEKGNGYRLNDALRQITFIFSTARDAFVVSPLNVQKVYVYGSISNWSQTDEDYILHGFADGCFYMTMPYSMIERTGNGGQPEYLFNVYRTNGNSYVTQSWSTADGTHSSTAVCEPHLTFCSNGYKNIVAWNDDDPADLLQRKTTALYIRKLVEFDLTDSIDQEKVSNFRRVPGTKHLYRSYHPYHSSRSQYDTEHARIMWVDSLATKVGIKCDLALSGSNEAEDGVGSYTVSGVTYTTTIPAYYRTIIDSARVLYVGTQNGHTPSYDQALYYTDQERFAQWMQELIRFVDDDAHPAPFQLHCALGADRTGIFSAVLAALCGASWDDIAADYMRTSDMQISEYRHSNQARYALYKLTGFDPMILNSGEGAAASTYTATTFADKKAASAAYTGGSMLFRYPAEGTALPTLQQAVADHFIRGGYLTQEEIDMAVRKLRGETASSIEQPAAADGCVKVVVNGHVLILRDGKTYDALGRLLH